MMKSVLMQPRLNAKVGAVRINYQINPYDFAAGPLRAMQKYAVIALTTKGTDTIRTWFGTNLASLPLMNMYNIKEVELFIRDQIKEATKQFFLLQKEESSTDRRDIIDSIELKGITIDSKNNIIIEVMFYPLDREAVILSLQV